MTLPTVTLVRPHFYFPDPLISALEMISRQTDTVCLSREVHEYLYTPFIHVPPYSRVRFSVNLMNI